MSVFRLVSLALALTMTGGPYVGLVCDLWCAPSAAELACHDGSHLSTDITAPDRCARAAPTDAALMRDEGRRAQAILSTDHLVSVWRFTPEDSIDEGVRRSKLALPPAITIPRPALRL